MSWFRAAITRQQTYFRESIRRIARQNLALMRWVACIALLLSVIIYLFTAIVMQHQHAQPELFIIIIALYAAFAVITQLIHCEKLHVSDSFVQGLSAAMYTALLVCAGTMSILPQPDMYAVFFTPVLVIMPVLLILPWYYEVPINTVVCALYAAGVLLFKSPAVHYHELLELAIAYVLSIVEVIMLSANRRTTDAIMDEYRLQAELDGLTGVFTKAAGIDHINKELARQTENTVNALLFIDVDDFKLVNDTYGHVEADRWLVMLSRLLTSTFRKEDIICRFGGDEFMVLLRNVGTAEVTRRKCDEVIRALDAPHAGGISNISGVTCSIGGYLFTGGLFSTDECIERADRMAYLAKRMGKHCYFVSEVNEEISVYGS